MRVKGRLHPTSTDKNVIYSEVVGSNVTRGGPIIIRTAVRNLLADVVLDQAVEGIVHLDTIAYRIVRLILVKVAVANDRMRISEHHHVVSSAVNRPYSQYPALIAVHNDGDHISRRMRIVERNVLYAIAGYDG